MLKLLAAGASTHEVEEGLGRQFGVSGRTIRQDMRKVFRTWARDDRTARSRLLSILLRRIDRGSRKSEEAENWSAMATFEALRLRFLESTIGIEAKTEDATGGLSNLPWATVLKAMQGEEQRELRGPVRLLEQSSLRCSPQSC